MKIVCIIPARGGSKGIPRKNIIDFCGKPLIAWTIGQALKSKFIDKVYVSTEDREIVEVSKLQGAEVIWRPRELAGDTSSSEEALSHALTEIEKDGKVDLVVFLQATSPLREDGDIDKAIKEFLSKRGDSLFSVAKLEEITLWESENDIFKSVTFDYKNRVRRQDRKPYYMENGSIYMFKPEILRQYNNRLGGKIIMYQMPLWKSYQIDSIEDLEICEYYMKSRILALR